MRKRLCSKGLITSVVGSKATLTKRGEVTLAKAIEAGTAETGTGSVHESAITEGDLPKGSAHQEKDKG